MTSFAFILGVVPLVLATGAGASARKSIGITVFSGMIASTCLAVLFVPSFFVVLQRFEEWRKARKAKRRSPTATVIGIPVQGVSSGQGMALMEQMAARILPPGTGYEWTALSYQEKLVGNQMYLVFGLGILLVYLVLAGQYESWYAPLAIVLSVPLALVGPASVAAGAQGRRQSLRADRPDPADRALGQERDPDRRGRARAAPQGRAIRSCSRRSRRRARASARS